MNRLKELLLYSELDLAAFILGIGLIAWGIIAFSIQPSDLISFSANMLVLSTLGWAMNYVLVGVGFVVCAWKKFPATLSLLVGGYACLVWTWVAAVRGASDFTSGITLNIIVIIMGVLLVQRSGQR